MRRVTKRELALSLHAAGRTVEQIAGALECSPSFIDNILTASGEAVSQEDLYTSAVAQNAYARMFRGVLRFRDVQAAQESVAKIDSLWRGFVDAGDRRGQHQSQLMALIGQQRAQGVGKPEEARLFTEWLRAHLETVAR